MVFDSYYIIQSAAIRHKFKSKIGGIQYSIRYVNLVRATVPINDGTKNRFLLLITFDIDAEADSIIQKKILPYVEDNRRYFL
jgi:hypothetical protein